MEIIIEQHKFDKGANLLKEYESSHILTFAEIGFSMLSHYLGPHTHEVDYPGNEHEMERLRSIVEAAVEEANKLGKLGTLYPEFPISMLRRRYFRKYRVIEQMLLTDETKMKAEQVMADFKTNIEEFIELNQSTIRATHILVDFCVGDSHQIPHSYHWAVMEAFIRSEKDSVVEKVILLQNPPQPCTYGCINYRRPDRN
jgi:hypothetical protein